jgi:acyl carrier protein
MNPSEILVELTTIVRDVIGDESIVLTMKTIREEIPNWDSTNYIIFMVAVEGRFMIKFKASDIESFPNIGAIVDKISQLTKGV